MRKLIAVLVILASVSCSGGQVSGPSGQIKSPEVPATPIPVAQATVSLAGLTAQEQDYARATIAALGGNTARWDGVVKIYFPLEISELGEWAVGAWSARLPGMVFQVVDNPSWGQVVFEVTSEVAAENCGDAKTTIIGGFITAGVVRLKPGYCIAGNAGKIYAEHEFGHILGLRVHTEIAKEGNDVMNAPPTEVGLLPVATKVVQWLYNSPIGAKIQ